VETAIRMSAARTPQRNERCDRRARAGPARASDLHEVCTNASPSVVVAGSPTLSIPAAVSLTSNGSVEDHSVSPDMTGRLQ
jgi:hypothetical protein